MAEGENHTYVDPSTIRATADHIGGLMDDMQPFYTLGSVQTLTGNFSTAQWLQARIQDRQSGLLQHGLDVKLVTADVKDGLHEVADLFEQTDENNAKNLERDLYHQVNVLKIGAYHSGQDAKELAKPAPADPDGQKYDGKSSEYDKGKEVYTGTPKILLK